jgi:hypothetical protein
MLKVCLIPLILGATLLAEVDLRVFRADLSASFGGVAGKLILHPNYLSFIDDQRPEASFAVEKGDIESLENEDRMVRIQLRSSVRDRTGETNRVVLRLTTPSEAASVGRWWAGGSEKASPRASEATAQVEEEMVFSARRKNAVDSKITWSLSSDQYRVLVDRVTRARTSQ